MLGFGFGFVEVGTLTPRPQAGNPRPRLFRLAEDRAVINRMGFNNRRPGGGAGAARAARPAARASSASISAPTRTAPTAIADYAAGVRAMAPRRRLSHGQHLLAQHAGPARAAGQGRARRAARGGAGGARAAGPPVFLKVAPDLEPADIDDIAAVAIDQRIDALIVANTTITPAAAALAPSRRGGGLSGAPLKALALQRLRDFRSATGGALPLIAAGGIENGADAFDRIRAGASLVQLYTRAGLSRGPASPRRIVRELEATARRDGFARLPRRSGSE